MRRFVVISLFALAAGTARAQESTYAPQESPGQVSLRALPTWSDTALVIEISANTHSVSLGGVDFGRQARLRVGEAVLAPVVEGSLAGHHASVRLIFVLPARPERFTLEIRDVPDVAVRRLAWPARDGGS